MALADTARAWAERDPNPTTKAHLLDLLAKNEDIGHLFDGRIGFGTAGLRAEMTVGPLGMNDLVVLQTAQGLVRYVREQGSSLNRSVVIGYDHRSNPSLDLSSRSFALYSALVFREAGFDVLLLDGFVHTPLVPFAVTRRACALGIMVTASHNPARDAGYKVYAADGCQIRPPMDTEIAHAINQELEPWVDYGARLASLSTSATPGDACLGLQDQAGTEQLTAEYFKAIQASGVISWPMWQQDKQHSARLPRFCYTAMHGVGYRAVRSMLRLFDGEDSCMTFGGVPVQSVTSQQEPDAHFPTVAFPNPEEKGALDLAQEHAALHGCDIVLANDPDADRLAVAERSPDGGWTLFTGDQVGTMLGHWLWTLQGPSSEKTVAMFASTVSSCMLRRIAEVEGFHFEDTLTGFKWIGSKAAERHNSGEFRSLFSYEEAIGFCCGDVVFDKDGVSAMAVICQLASHVYAQKGQTLQQHLQTLYDKYGEFVSHNGYFVYDDPGIPGRVLDRIRNGGDYVDRVCSCKVESVRDLGSPGYDSLAKDGKPTLPTSGSSPLLTLRFENNCVLQLRASGTEPKFKYYTEMRGAPGVARSEVTAALQVFVEGALEELLHPSQNGLRRP